MTQEPNRKYLQDFVGLECPVAGKVQSVGEYICIEEVVVGRYEGVDIRFDFPILVADHIWVYNPNNVLWNPIIGDHVSFEGTIAPYSKGYTLIPKTKLEGSAPLFFIVRKLTSADFPHLRINKEDDVVIFQKNIQPLDYGELRGYLRFELNAGNRTYFGLAIQQLGDGFISRFLERLQPKTVFSVSDKTFQSFLDSKGWTSNRDHNENVRRAIMLLKLLKKTYAS